MFKIACMPNSQSNLPVGGFHVLYEKPLGVDAKECIEVAEGVEKAGIVFALGHSKRLERPD